MNLDIIIHLGSPDEPGWYIVEGMIQGKKFTACVQSIGPPTSQTIDEVEKEILPIVRSKRYADKS